MDDAMFQIYPRRKASDIDSINQAIFEKKNLHILCTRSLLALSFRNEVTKY